MTQSPDWGRMSRFYLPNEDAAVVRRALAALGATIRRPVFVGGSGMVLLDALAELPELERAEFVDLAPFQVEYFGRLLTALEHCPSAAQLRDWFAAEVYPELKEHFLGRNQRFELAGVLKALDERFSIRFFSEDAVLEAIRPALARIGVQRSDILGYLAAPGAEHDFVYLSNVPDYLSGPDLERLFAVCRGMNAPVYLLLTSACGDADSVRRSWERHGYRSHSVSNTLTKDNRGLGSQTLNAAWNRPGGIHLLTPCD